MEQQQAPSLVKIALKYGLIQGVIGIVVFLAKAVTMFQPDWIFGAVSFVVFVVLMILAHREFKKTHGGMMAYSQGLGSGTLLATVAAAITCVLQFIYTQFINTGYLPAVQRAQQIALEQRGFSAVQLQQGARVTGVLMTPPGAAISGFVFAVILGFIVALIVSIFTQAADPKAVY